MNSVKKLDAIIDDIKIGTLAVADNIQVPPSHSFLL